MHTGQMRIMVGGDDAPLAERMAELGGSYGAEVTATVGGFSALMRAAGRERPNVVVTTVGPSYADHGKIATALNLRRGDPAAGVVLLSRFVEVSYTKDLVAVGGGVGYLQAGSLNRPADVVLALRRVASGGFGFDAEVIGNLFGCTWVPELRSLGTVEREVVRLVAEGWSDDAIAARLWFDEATVVKVVTEVFTKLGLEPEADTTRRAFAVLSRAAERTSPPS
ncbi:DNA-binding response regulator [Actinoallomurus iriomotensis]|uniref:DNA-binding response regulator n=2 Tax=Actinoallomurus iriomotensis TaxID=478107 RepID=A0A9W6RVB7_9ACTN|nr:DNA-binding response regulator [Actinoallomurus iriomotensis]